MTDTPPDLAREAMALEHQRALYQTRMDFWKVVAGTMVVGVAVALFPVIQKVMESYYLVQIEQTKALYQENIEKTKAESQIAVIERQNALELQRLETEDAYERQQLQTSAAFEAERLVDTRLAESRAFLNNQALEGRSEDIETRIRLAEYFSFVASTEPERKQWTGFREYLVNLRDRQQAERAKLRAIELDETKPPLARLLAQEGIAVIDRELTPSAVAPQGSGLKEAVPFGALGLDRQTVNGDLRPAQRNVLLRVFGAPSSNPGPVCAMPDNEALNGQMASAEHNGLRVTLLKPAAQSLEKILRDIAADNSTLRDALGSAGGLCVRLIRGSATQISNHSWGLAIDLTVDGQLDFYGDNRVQRGLAQAAPYFIRNGWYWGAGFAREESMHFEVSAQLLQRWIDEGQVVSRSAVNDDPEPDAGTVPAQPQAEGDTAPVASP
ncbi:M15 family metallopeptidase [Fertoebacter nigrum]|uniref:M15 family metallopeptidase n=1 Tax=Fertoeibacter niger TaxID=2656921 RepID=A0A8X8H1S9_9RHOB|nr:M15 family metallopeptidase [Fertoeibacter niger]NUB44684.1 M15 family metallopeptidase [Fertoeibacter niger]